MVYTMIGIKGELSLGRQAAYKALARRLAVPEIWRGDYAQVLISMKPGMYIPKVEQTWTFRTLDS